MLNVIKLTSMMLHLHEAIQKIAGEYYPLLIVDGIFSQL